MNIYKPTGSTAPGNHFTPSSEQFGTMKDALSAKGWWIERSLLSVAECSQMIETYADYRNFRSTIVMERHSFGKGQYRYYDYPLPGQISDLRQRWYARLAPIANEWNTLMRKDQNFSKDHETYLKTCHRAGQKRPTPLILRYRPGDYNCLHQDLYGDMVFPLQMAVLLSSPGKDFDGGEFVMTEQRPRMQSIPHVLPLCQGDAAIFAVNERPKKGTRGHYRVKMRHGVSEVRRGERYTLGVIFHDAT